jgi:hypothetical protein
MARRWRRFYQSEEQVLFEQGLGGPSWEAAANAFTNDIKASTV